MRPQSRLALEILKEKSFDLCLMDVNMPEMDGLAATAALREQEKATGKHLPVIAMTAHALKGDKERCLAAGMDDYISKPIQPDVLFEMIEALKSGQLEIDSVDRKEETTALELDTQAMLRRMEGDSELLKEICAEFLKMSPSFIEKLSAAMQAKNTAELEKTAHTIKGAVGNFEARDAVDASQALEKIARAGDLELAEDACARLIMELGRLDLVLKSLIEKDL